MKTLEEAQKLIPNLSVFINGNVGKIYIRNILVFETTGPEVLAVIDGYLMGLVVGYTLAKH
jgi:hypothetical protein